MSTCIPERHSARPRSRSTAPTAVLVGDLTIKGVTRPVRLETDYLGHAVDPWGNERAVFTARGRINREDWGLTWNMLLETGGLLVSKEITIELDLELIKDLEASQDAA